MRLILFRILLLTLIFCKGAFAETVEFQISVNGEERRYLSTAAIPQNAPVLIVLHGGGGKPEWAHYRSGDFGLADWAVIYPAAAGERRWNDGRRGPDGKELTNTDDVAFLSALVDQMLEQGARPDAVFAVGDSNGGMMVLRLICEIGPKLSGAAVLIGNQPIGLDCPDQSPIPMLFIHGTGDSVTPYAGGEVAKSGERLGHIKSVEETMELARIRNGCGAFIENELPREVLTDPTSVRFRAYTGCKQPLLHYIVDGGGHSWPGKPHDSAKIEKRFGPTSMQLDADKVIADFFNKLADE